MQNMLNDDVPKICKLAFLLKKTKIKDKELLNILPAKK